MTSTEFNVEVTDHGLGYNLPQRIGQALWLPMLLMALMAFALGVILGIVRASEITSGGSESTIAALGHFIPAAIFLGFASVLAAVSFAIARILGELRVGGGGVQEAAQRNVHTLRMPNTAKAFLALMAMAMMVLLGAVVLHVVVGASILGGSGSALENAGSYEIWLEAVRRIGMAVYLFGIAFGLASIIYVLRFQSVRIRELPGEVA